MDRPIHRGDLVFRNRDGGSGAEPPRIVAADPHGDFTAGGSLTTRERATWSSAHGLTLLRRERIRRGLQSADARW
ncbi:MAG: hypothetical protein ACOYEV_15555 [Candidatus Nanopelagicales bacterium]